MCCMLMHAMHHGGHGSRATRTASQEDGSLLEILKRRYALGEISREQFEEMKHTLDAADAAETSAHAHHARKE